MSVLLPLLDEEEEDEEEREGEEERGISSVTFSSAERWRNRGPC
jgi:hypothetical protein